MPSKVSRCDILTYYKHEVQELRKVGREWNLTDDEIDKVLNNSFSFLEEELYTTRNNSPPTVIKEIGKFNIRYALRKTLYIFCGLVCLLLILNALLIYHKPSYNFVVRNIQEYIYPSMRFLRWATLPVVKFYPFITVWYDELCLIENPYFEATDVNCWACEDIRSVLDLTGTDNPWKYQPNSVFPFIVKGESATVTLDQLHDLYKRNKLMMNRDAHRITCSNSRWSDLESFMNYSLEYQPTENQESHIVWRVNRLDPARALRKLFPRPKLLPSTVNVERYIIIDELKSEPYKLPFPEGYKVFLMQVSGERLVVLNPVPTCALNCMRISVIMKPSYFLFYNGWFYRASSYPVDNSSSNISISYLGSF